MIRKYGSTIVLSRDCRHSMRAHAQFTKKNYARAIILLYMYSASSPLRISNGIIHNLFLYIHSHSCILIEKKYILHLRTKYIYTTLVEQSCIYTCIGFRTIIICHCMCIAPSAFNEYFDAYVYNILLQNI